MKRSILLSAAVAVFLFTSCKKDKDDEAAGNFIYGKNTPMGNGSARSFLANVNNHEMMELGVALDLSAINGLPHTETSFLLELPEEAAKLTPYKHISLEWTPHGHEPNGVYDQPHFDVHFYMISRDEQNAISASDPGMQKLPDSNFLPRLYVPEPGGVDKMGKHWADITSPELDPVNPKPFTCTMIYGSYNSKVVFLEPMITRDFLLSNPDTIITIKQPQKFAVSSLYPEKYKIRHDKALNKLIISLADFRQR